ncbi:hypothetical protein BIU82_04355 [Arthrobacter sp. SW1]|uniref:DUF6707 family protein n=1 Tax=Arthrobacter sp. SW1 TaxID=1920889 RepID=UPI000877B96E|nr:DUF6707 family protein [Arthrobacter sp. SW1]OFI38557.1 hypothetical protein BIU82_04355 [Arthrobacter sp. SW1]
MTHSPADQQYREKQAGALQSGDYLYLPGDGPAEEITGIELEYDDFGAPALIIVTTADGGRVRIAFSSSVPVGEPGSGTGTPDVEDAPSAEPAPASELTTPAAPAVVVPPLPAAPPTLSGPTAAQLALIPAPSGTPEAVIAAAAEAHPGRNGVAVLSERLVKGVNTKSGSCLRDISDLAHDLFIQLRDPENALAVADILNLLPFDGNRDRWTSIERSLALSGFICRELGQEERAEVYSQLLKAPDSLETDPFRARIAARVRQRALNEPNLYDKEIFRSIDNGNHDAEREWRMLRFESLLFLRAHGGSETLRISELDHRLANELEAIRA